MAGVRATLTVSLIALLSGAAVAGETPTYRADFEETLQFEPGTGTDGQADLLYSATRTLGASATEVLDFAGALSTALGLSIAAAEIVAIIVKADPLNTNNVEFGPTPSVGFVAPFKDITDRLTLKPGALVVLAHADGWPITAATADQWTFTNSAGTTGVTYTIHVIARTIAA